MTTEEQSRHLRFNALFTLPLDQYMKERWNLIPKESKVVLGIDEIKSPYTGETMSLLSYIWQLDWYKERLKKYEKVEG